MNNITPTRKGAAPHGFTLVEVLCAVVIFALGAMILIGLFSRLARHHYTARHYQQAAWRLDELLEKYVQAQQPPAGADVIQGDFGWENEDERFRYRMEIKPTSDPAVQKVTAWVFWTEIDHERQISAATLVYREPTAQHVSSP